MIASGLSIQDPRERPAGASASRPTRCTPASASTGPTCCRWSRCGTTCASKQRELSGNQFRRMCRNEFLNYLRVREWMDLFSQLRRVAGELGIRPATPRRHDSHPDLVHQSLLAGLLSHVGVRDRERREFLGARQARFVIATGSVLTRRPPDWVMAAELVETNQIYARRVAGDQAAVGRTGRGAPREAVVRRGPLGRARRPGRRHRDASRCTGCRSSTDRVIGYDRVDPDGGAGLVHHQGARRRTRPRRSGCNATTSSPATPPSCAACGGWPTGCGGSRSSTTRCCSTSTTQRVGREVTSTQHFDRWWKEARRTDPTRLDLTERSSPSRCTSVASPPTSPTCGGRATSNCRSRTATRRANRSTA